MSRCAECDDEDAIYHVQATLDGIPAKRIACPVGAACLARIRDQARSYTVLPLYNADGAIDAHLLSEGQRKIASLVRLIVNGSLTSNDLLFWDEPEANLNPRLVTKVATALRALAAVLLVPVQVPRPIFVQHRKERLPSTRRAQMQKSEKLETR